MAHSTGTIRSDLGSSCTYDILPRDKSPKVTELPPGLIDDNVSTKLHTVE